MTTSGNTIYQRTRDQLITAALRKVTFAKGQVPDSEDIANASEALNNLVEEFHNVHGMPLWKRTEYTLPLVGNQRDYSIGVGKPNNTPYPVHLHQAILHNTASESEIDVTIMSRYDFNLLPQTTANTGVPVNISYQPYINYGVVSVWPTPSTQAATDNTLILVYRAPAEYFDTATDTPDFPQGWSNALTYGLALLLADEYGMPIQDKQWLETQAMKHLDSATMSGGEDASLFFYPDRR